jgi:hypothetical protein
VCGRRCKNNELQQGGRMMEIMEEGREVISIVQFIEHLSLQQ